MGILRGFAYGVGDALVSQAFAEARRRPLPPPGPSTPLPAVLTPAAALGVCGIQSLRRHIAVRNARYVLHQMCEEHPDLPIRLSVHVDVLSTRGAAHNIVLLGDRVLLVQSEVDESSVPLPDAVAAVDDLASAVSALAPHGSRPTAVVCIANSTEEPRELPGPSGRAVTVTGHSWLAGISRRTVLGADLPAHGDGTRSRLEQHMDVALWTMIDLDAVYYSLLPDPSWWVIRHLRLGDGIAEPIELAAVGPTGAFALRRAAWDNALAAQEHAQRDARRLQAYLPWIDCTPIVIDRNTDPNGQPLAAATGCSAGWALQPDGVAAALRHSPTRGIDSYTLAYLNTPAHGWTRLVSGTPDNPIVDIHWRS